MATPMYRQIAEDLSQQIESGELARGSQLPSELELGEQYAAPRNTVRDAVKWLIRLGLVESRPGQGTFVVMRANPFVTTLSGHAATGLGGGEGACYLSEASKNNRKPSSSRVRVEIQAASDAIAGQLLIPAGSNVISRHQQRFIDETAWSLQTSFYPMGLADQGAERLLAPDDIAEGTVRYVAAVLGIEQAGYRDWIVVRVPNATEAGFFKLPADRQVAVLEIVRTAFDQSGKPFRVTVTVFPSDRNQFVINVGDVPTSQHQPEGRR